jgi:hypothetical protein
MMITMTTMMMTMGGRGQRQVRVRGQLHRWWQGDEGHDNDDGDAAIATDNNDNKDDDNGGGRENKEEGGEEKQLSWP